MRSLAHTRRASLHLHAQAVCNDGTPGAFYFHKASDTALANVWLVFLEGTRASANAKPRAPSPRDAVRLRMRLLTRIPTGGDWCYSDVTCAQRHASSPQFMSSKGWPGVVSLGGILDNNPLKSPWAGANKAYVGYCSSDAWVGDVAASAATFGLAFRGQRIVSATLQFLITNHGLGSTPGQRLLFAGCSAGSRGAMFTADYLPAMLTTMGVNVSNLEIQGLFDSPLWVDVEPISGPSGIIVPLEVQTQAILGLVGASNRLGDACAAAYPGTEAWKCLYGKRR
jgi:hypothetical protein